MITHVNEGETLSVTFGQKQVAKIKILSVNADGTVETQLETLDGSTVELIDEWTDG